MPADQAGPRISFGGKMSGDGCPSLVSPECSFHQPPEAQPGQAERDARDAQTPAPHAEARAAGQDLCPLLLELRLPGDVAVCSQAQERAAACDYIQWLVSQDMKKKKKEKDREAGLTDDLAGQTVVTAVLFEQGLQILGLFQRVEGWQAVLGHGGRGCDSPKS
jgi:hypothetical protein